MGRLKNKVILVTGGARGMGAAHARLLVAEGARVVITDILHIEGEALAAKLGESTVYVPQDVTQPKEWAEAVASAERRFGALHGLVNNAGIANMAPIEQFPLDQWNKTLAVNLTGVFLGMQAALPAIRRAGGGSVVNISSVEGLRGSAGLHAYVASKFGVRGITKSAALEAAASGVRVNSIHPGFIATPMTESFESSLFPVPLGRAAEPQEVSQAVLFLLSDESSYLTGSEIVIDGGLTIGVPRKCLAPENIF
ncbi:MULTISPECIES: glucose 1-dehydrogenase [Bradyrhizobium]|jgi:3alpha(or 20beta)-hydroxysteroid dehydrogenase|uniref:3alpha(Or 20beta)-hydroxysteroid dehydrogenase n=1 Tax=Bradyrhizobium elkanii TaxID=29448 RepID=A0A8I1Y7G4_BRAEL|nr:MULTISPECIES: glucose 1-dehydrogenase [Bradyrhizobium]MBP1293685.1 3alpha(or 20beta)-hydroxysteroid dehydrogenase [Bradyrhizobium elkanii]MCP1925734.1 3alpha(or 20beta)-hydroxysteroid dehydrogenase [Bradyrhizobium elkanii]MCS3476777.1 3alpha(or 20beta)-hydroxysteroid dehydrogenase [Bradyrhizobium elkanii]MCS3583513.1 3alpha(or 20beta)-hydroxysteroid dehydrogenase [Bradyrhizobium elkanii]MCS3717082.1 3alpha(or 20beta)-hydroxysteroid dehydrogenase [Bradyrhizobium elkanii]